jgi:hypothetical protein
MTQAQVEICAKVHKILRFLSQCLTKPNLPWKETTIRVVFLVFAIIVGLCCFFRVVEKSISYP